MQPAEGKQTGGLGGDRSAFLTEEKYEQFIACLQQSKVLDKRALREKWSQCYAWSNKYALFGDGAAAILIHNRVAEKESAAATVGGARDNIVYVSHAGRVFEDLHAIHVYGDHAKPRPFLHMVRAKFGKSISERVCMLFIEYCPEC